MEKRWRILSIILFGVLTNNSVSWSGSVLYVDQNHTVVINNYIENNITTSCIGNEGTQEPNLWFACYDDKCGIIKKWNVRLWEYTCSVVNKTLNTHINIQAGAYLEDSSIYDSSEYSVDFNRDQDYDHNSIQQKALSCESSATADILSKFLDKKITEDDVINVLPKDMFDQPSIKEWNTRIWWNPNKGFVWYIDKTSFWVDALQYMYEWYGVLEEPISEVYKSYWFKTEIITEDNYLQWFNSLKHLIYLLKSYTQWSEVQLWGDICTNPSEEDWTVSFWNFTQADANKNLVWKNNCIAGYDSSRVLVWYYKNELWELEKHIWLNGEHAFYLMWYKWNIDNPTHIIVWDTLTWKHSYTTKEWMRKWWKMQYRSIIIHNQFDEVKVNELSIQEFESFEVNNLWEIIAPVLEKVYSASNIYVFQLSSTEYEKFMNLRESLEQSFTWAIWERILKLDDIKREEILWKIVTKANMLQSKTTSIYEKAFYQEVLFHIRSFESK